jgi:hypothetical protein
MSAVRRQRKLLDVAPEELGGLLSSKVVGKGNLRLFVPRFWDFG